MFRSRRHDRPTSASADAPDAPGDAPAVGFVPPRVKDVDVATNVQWNRERWGQEQGWRSQDGYGYRWGGGVQQTVGMIARLADTFFRPETRGRYDLSIVELAPGGGRFTAELLRYASRMCLVDLNASALEVCQERFQYVPTEMITRETDGSSLAVVPGPGEWDAVVCFDSMVHMHPDVIRGYVISLAPLLVPGGFAWLDHSGKGQRDAGHRTAMTAELMVEFAQEAGLQVSGQHYRNDWDCISVLRSPA